MVMTRTVSFITFNIRNGRALDGANSWPFRRRWVPGYVRSLDADVIGLQEAYHNQVLAFDRALPEYVRIGVGRDNGRARGEFCPLYVRSSRLRVMDHGTFWFSDTPEVPGSRTWGNTLPRIATRAVLAEPDRPDQALLTVCNVHLDHASAHARLMSARMLLDRVAVWRRTAPVIVMGDFNAGEDDPVMRLLLTGDGCLRDTLRVLHPDAAEVATFHAWEGGTRGARIDYILATSGVTVLEAGIRHDTVAGRLPSDHWPVTALIETGPGNDVPVEARS